MALAGTRAIPLKTTIRAPPAEYTPEPGNVDRGTVQTWNIAIERRLPFDISADVAYVGAKGANGYAALDINAPTVLGTGNQGRLYLYASAKSLPAAERERDRLVSLAGKGADLFNKTMADLFAQYLATTDRLVRQTRMSGPILAAT